MINMRKMKLFLKFHWVKIVVAIGCIAIAISLIIFLRYSIGAWILSERYTKRQMLAQYSVFFYVILVSQVISMPIYALFWYWLMFRGGSFKMTSMLKKTTRKDDINIHWNDVVGMDEAKQEALEVVRLIKDRAELQRIGGRILRGLLMIGPPGCGKTYLAKAMATEANIPFLSMSGSEFVEMFVGVGSSRVRKLFKRARQLAYSEGGCVIFIDELDAVGARRAVDAGFGGQSEFNTTLNQLLVEMDGLKEKDYNIIVMGATNAPESFLDPALLRPGRFDRKIYVDKPNLEDREKLFAYYLKEVKYDPNDVKVDRLARITVDQSPADIANLVRESALIAVRNKKTLISMKEIDEARERIALGIKRRIRLSQREKLHTAYHEAGHAIITYLLVPSQDVFKITITPRGHTGGVTWTPEREEIFIHDRNHYAGEIKACLGSYAAEKLKIGFTTGGVTGDFETAIWYAHNMVWRWGMGRSGIIGNFYGLPKDRNNMPMMSEEMKRRLDEDVQDILQSCLRDVEELLKKHDPLLERLGKELVAKEELNYDEIEAIFKEFGLSRPQTT
ncbi:MAG: AAA family ATPase [Candidatus Omnitrophica bacterium]|nr:AAA family ATPase [Candidatus Omnitrophota bacterium]